LTLRIIAEGFTCGPSNARVFTTPQGREEGHAALLIIVHQVERPDKQRELFSSGAWAVMTPSPWRTEIAGQSIRDGDWVKTAPISQRLSLR
jgi:hypothetical protein